MAEVQWQKVKDIFNAAMRRNPDERRRFINRACGVDKQLLTEVESLVSSLGKAESFMEMPAVGEAAGSFADGKTFKEGICFGHYEIIKQIGSGGMGEVYLANDKKLDRKVAVKILNEKFSRHESNLERFIREAKAASSLNHPNILVIHEIGETGEAHYIVSEYIEGVTLRDIFKEKRLELKEVLDISIQVANALSVAHQARLIHRDIKPENIMIRPDGLVKILDFGLAKIVIPTALGFEEPTDKPNDTAQGLIMGTVNYMSPEQAKGERVEERTDIFSFGAVIYEMIAAELPFAGDSMSETFANLINAEAQPLSRFAEGVPDELQRMISNMLRKNKDERYQTMKDVFEDLRNFGENLAFGERLKKLRSSGAEEVAENEAKRFEAAATGFYSRTAQTNRGFMRRLRRHESFAAVMILLGGIAVVTLFGFAFRQFTKIRQADLPFRQIALNRLTSSGKAKLVALSPDGNLIAFVTAEKDGNSLSVRQVGMSSTINVVSPRAGEFVCLTFSADGRQIYYSFFPGDKIEAELYSVPALGGISRRIPNFVTLSMSFAPDGKRFVHTTSDSGGGETGLAIEDFAGGGELRQLTAHKMPGYFSVAGQVCSWSPDGEIVAAVANDADERGGYSTLVGVSLRDGAEKPLSAKRWVNLESVAWRRSGNGLLVVGSDKPAMPDQIWFVSYPDGEARQLTNDLNDYSSLGVSANENLIVSVQSTQTNSIWIGEIGQNQNDFRQIASETGMFSPLEFASDDRLIFRSNADGGSNLWMMRTDGGERRQITADAQAGGRGICVTPGSKQIVFDSSRSGKSNLWRVDTDGENLTRLTDGEREGYPVCSPDGQFVIYQKGFGAGIKSTLWKISSGGGEPVKLTDYFAFRPALSPDGSRLAFFYMTEDKWRVGVASSGGGAIRESYDLPDDVPDRIARWSANNRDLLYAANIGEVGNIRQLSPNGQTKQITDFNSNLVEAFALSPNGRKLAVTRTTDLSDVVGIAEQP